MNVSCDLRTILSHSFIPSLRPGRRQPKVNMLRCNCWVATVDFGSWSHNNSKASGSAVQAAAVLKCGSVYGKLISFLFFVIFNGIGEVKKHISLWNQGLNEHFLIYIYIHIYVCIFFFTCCRYQRILFWLRAHLK